MNVKKVFDHVLTNQLLIILIKWNLFIQLKNWITNFMNNRKPPVRKTPVPDRSSSEKSSEESASLKSAENNQNYQIWSRINRVIQTFLFISLPYNARRKRNQSCKQASKIIFINHIWLKKNQKNLSYIKHQLTNQLHQSVLHQIDLFTTIQRKHQVFEIFQHFR